MEMRGRKNIIELRYKTGDTLNENYCRQEARKIFTFLLNAVPHSIYRHLINSMLELECKIRNENLIKLPKHSAKTFKKCAGKIIKRMEEDFE